MGNAYFINRIIKTLPIGLNRISWKRIADQGSESVFFPTDWVKSD